MFGHRASAFARGDDRSATYADRQQDRQQDLEDDDREQDAEQDLADDEHFASGDGFFEDDYDA